MSDLDYWRERLRAAEAELEAATRRGDVNDAPVGSIASQKEQRILRPLERARAHRGAIVRLP